MTLTKKKTVGLIVFGIIVMILILFKTIFHNTSKGNLSQTGSHKSDIMDKKDADLKPANPFDAPDIIPQTASQASMSLNDILNTYASKNMPHEQFKGYNTVAHRFFDITNAAGSRLMLNRIVDEAIKRLELNSPDYLAFVQNNFENVDQEIDLVTSILTDLDTLFRSEITILSKTAYDQKFGVEGHSPYGYDLIVNDPDTEQIMLKKRDGADVDKDSLSLNTTDEKQALMNFLAAGEAMQLPVSMVHGLRQSFLAWKLSDGSHIYFDTQKGQMVDEFVLVPSFMHDKLKEKGYFLTPLTPEETIGEAYNERGNTYFESSEYLSAAGDFCKAIQLNPKNINAYLMAASAFEKAGKDQESAAILNEAKKLDYGFLMTREQ